MGFGIRIGIQSLLLSEGFILNFLIAPKQLFSFSHKVILTEFREHVLVWIRLVYSKETQQ